MMSEKSKQPKGLWGSYVIYSCIVVLYLIQLGDYVVARFFLPLTALVLFVVYWVVNCFLNNEKIINSDSKYIISVFSVLIICSMFGVEDLKSLGFDFIKISLAIFSYSVGKHIVEKSDLKLLSLLFHLAIYISIVFLFFEYYIRMYVPFGLLPNVANFYLLKVESPFFFDSNAVGIYAVCILSFLVFSKEYIKIIFFKTCCFMLVFLIFFTFSRAAYFAAISIFCFYFFVRVGFLLKIIILFSMFSVFLFGISDIFNLLNEDGSGSTKFDIYKAIFSKFSAYSVSNQLFGFGIENGNFAYSYEEGGYAHALLPMLLGEVGVIGTITYFIFWIYTLTISKTKVGYIFIPILVLGFSFLPPFYETLFFVAGMMVGSVNSWDLNLKSS